MQKKLVIMCLALTGGVLLVLLFSRSPGKATLPAHPRLPPVQDPAADIVPEDGSPEVCAFWRPWEDALAPHEPSVIMRDIASRARMRATRTETFKSWARAKPQVPEHICATGTKINGDFVMDLVTPGSGCIAGPSPLDYAIDMRVAPSASRRFNAFALQLTTDTFSAARLRQLIADQTRLLHLGYPGWERAFPDFGNRDLSGLAIRHAAEPKPDDQAMIEAEAAWDPQRFWQGVPILATWLLNLGSLVDLETTVTNGDGVLIAHAATSTRALGSRVRFPLTKGGLTLAPDESFDLIVSHNVTISYKGLVIVVRDLRFTGRVEQAPERMSYNGRFAGIGGVEVSGEYKGLSALGVSEMIRKLIREAVEAEADVLANGNNGKGWVITASLAPAPHQPGRHQFSLAMEVESPIHITQLIRYESDEKASQVLPGRAESYEFGNYVDGVLATLVRDSRRFRCGNQR
jgi:hypothetical protein